MIVEWVIKFKGPLLVVKYEDLQANAVCEVLRILDFLKFDFNEESVRRALVQDFRLATLENHITCITVLQYGACVIIAIKI